MIAALFPQLFFGVAIGVLGVIAAAVNSLSPGPPHVEPVRPSDEEVVTQRLLDRWDAELRATKAKRAAHFWREVNGPQPPALTPEEFAATEMAIIDLLSSVQCRVGDA